MSTIVRLGQRESTNARGPVWYDSTPVCELGFREFSFVLYSATPPLQPTTAAPVLRSTWYLGLFVSCLTYTVGSDKQILLSSSRTILLYYDDNESIDSNACVCGPAVSPAGSSAWSNNEPRRRLGIVQGTEIHSLKNTQCIVLNARRRTSQNASCAPLYCTILVLNTHYVQTSTQVDPTMDTVLIIGSTSRSLPIWWGSFAGIGSAVGASVTLSCGVGSAVSPSISRRDMRSSRAGPSGWRQGPSICGAVL